MGRRKSKTYKRKTYKRKTRRKTKTRKKYKGGRKFFEYEKKIKLNLDKNDVPTPTAGWIRERRYKVSLQTPWIVWIGILCSTIASLSLSLGAGSLVAIIGFVVNKLIQYMKKPKMDLLVSMELEEKILEIIKDDNQEDKKSKIEDLKLFLIENGYTLDDIKNTTEYLASKAVAGANPVAVAKPVAGAKPVAEAKGQKKVLFFDWDDTLAIKLRSNDEIQAAKTIQGDKDNRLVMINDGESRNYTTNTIIKLLQDLTNNSELFMWFIVSCGNNKDQFETLKTSYGIKPTGEVWLNLGAGCAPNDKLGAIQTLIKKYNLENTQKLFIDDDADNLNLICDQIANIHPIQPGLDEGSVTLPANDYQQATILYGTFFIKYSTELPPMPKKLLIKSKINDIYTFMGNFQKE
jgi:hypothetical protein